MSTTPVRCRSWFYSRWLWTGTQVTLPFDQPVLMMPCLYRVLSEDKSASVSPNYSVHSEYPSNITDEAYCMDGGQSYQVAGTGLEPRASFLLQPRQGIIGILS